MNRRYKSSLPVRLTSISVAWFALACTPPSFADAVDIVDGTYQLVSRQLPDGTMQKPPQIIGSMTMWKGHRNVNVLTTNEDGKMGSVSIVSMYTLTNTEFVETLKFRVISSEASGKPLNYLVSSPAKSAPVEVHGNRVTFKPPYTQPSLLFDGDGMTSTLEGKFVDTWKKVK